jgi:invasion protein IalB
MRVFLLAGAMLTASPALANEPASLVEAAFTSVMQPGEKIAPGDFASLTRVFDTWITVCDYRLSLDRRVCRVQQSLSSNGRQLLWRIGPTTDGRNSVLIVLSGDRPLDDSFAIENVGLKRPIPSSAWRCANGQCSTVFSYDTTFQNVFMQPGVKFSYRQASKETSVAVDFPASLSGFAEAAAATAPSSDLLASNRGKALESKPAVRAARKKTSSD